MKYFDAHCHIQFDMFDEDRTALIQSMHEQGVGGIVVGVDYDSSVKAIALAATSDELFAGVGLHPNDTQNKEFDFDAFSELVKDPKVVTIGECGLDYFRPEDVANAKQLQKEVFQKHIQLSAETRKPLMIHARPSKGTQDAYQDLVALLKEGKKQYGDALTGNVHFFVGGIDEARSLLELDFTMSYTAVLTFTHDYDDVVRYIPLTHILTETDSPYAAPAPNRGKRNDPRSIPAIAAAIAVLKGQEVGMVQETILANARRVFSLST
jgi:TatD DNase family protein